ncbi:MAG: ArsR/SmtB family transcription factor [Thermoplasmata archaeon]
MMDDPRCKLLSLAPLKIEDFEKEADLYEVLGSTIRLSILYLMKKYGEVCTCELIPALNLSQPTITSHLNKLYRAGIIKKREHEKFTFYSINEEFMDFLDRIFENMKRKKSLRASSI